MDNFGKINELDRERKQKQKTFLAVGYFILLAMCSGAIGDGNFIAGFIISLIISAFCAGPIFGGLAVYNEAARLRDCKQYLSKETYEKLMKLQAKREAQQAKKQQEELLSPGQKTAAKTAAAGYIGYKVGKGIAKW